MLGAADRTISAAATTTPSSAPAATPPEIAPPSDGTTPPKSFWTADYLTQPWLGFRDTWQKDGISFKPDWTAEIQGNPVGGARHGAITEGLVDLPLELNLDTLTGGALKDTLFHAEAFYIYGPELSSHFVGDFSVTSGIAAYNSLRLDELWIQKGLWNNQVSVRVGNLAIDTEFFQSNSAALYFGSTFGAFTLLANNFPDAPQYPLASPGVRIRVQPDPHYYVMAGVYGLDNGINPATNDQNGTRFALNGASGVFIATEAGYLLNQGPNDKGLQGTYELGAFIDTGDTQPFLVAGGMPTPALHGYGADFAIYGVVDQQIYADGPASINLFTRAGGAPSNSNFVDFYADGGFNFTGFVPGRGQDVAGLAVARSHVSQDFSDEQVAAGSPPLHAETYIEATYKVQLTPWWNVQPDVQYIVTPSGVQGSHDALVLGLRTYVLF
ncbi:MAG: carbohydrate porin [Verrucomicrobiota bacterium]